MWGLAIYFFFMLRTLCPPTMTATRRNTTRGCGQIPLLYIFSLSLSSLSFFQGPSSSELSCLFILLSQATRRVLYIHSRTLIFTCFDSAPPTLKQQEVTKDPSLYYIYTLYIVWILPTRRGHLEITAKMCTRQTYASQIVFKNLIYCEEVKQKKKPSFSQDKRHKKSICIRRQNSPP